MNTIVQRGEHLRDAKWPEVAILALVLVNGQLVLWRIVGSTGLFHGGTGVGAWSFPAFVVRRRRAPARPVRDVRWMWRWVIWTFMLAWIAKLPLSLLATHPDGATGLGCLVRPVSGFSAFSAAIGAVIAAAWGTQVLSHRTTLAELIPGVFVLLVASLALATGQLLMFCGHLYRVRRRGLAHTATSRPATRRRFSRQVDRPPGHARRTSARLTGHSIARRPRHRVRRGLVDAAVRVRVAPDRRLVGRNLCRSHRCSRAR